MSLKKYLNFSSKPVYLVDGSAFILRACYAKQHVRRADGFPVNALSIVSSLLVKILKEEAPEHVVFVLDGEKSSFRRDIYKNYKAYNPVIPKDVALQIELIKEMVQHFGVYVIVSDRCEAGDSIASLVKRFKQKHPVVIVGADRKLQQCLDTNVALWDPWDEQGKVMMLDSFIKETGLLPSQLPDYLALVGNITDNIPSVPKIGPKVAKKILAQFGSLEAVRDGFEGLDVSLKEKLAGHLESVFMFRTLTTLGTATCDKQELEDVKLQPISRDIVLRFVDEYQLRELVPEVSSFFIAEDIFSGANKKNVTDQLSHTGREKQEIVNEPKRNCVVCVNDVFSFIPCAGKRLAVLLKENTKGDSFLVAVGGIEYLYEGPMRELVEYAKAATCIITPDLKSLYNTSSMWFSIASEKFLDLGLLAYLLRPEEKDFSWGKLASRADGLGISGEYHGLLALGLAEKFERELDDNGLRQLMMYIELPLVKVLVNMEKVGVGINRTYIKDFMEELQVNISRCESEIFDIAGKEFNIMSSKQLGKVLYEDLGLVFKDKALGRPTSTPKEVLVQLDDPSGIVDYVLVLRKLKNLHSSDLTPLLEAADDNDRVHTTFNQLAAVTGRLSSRAPNLQSIPVRGEYGKRMRRCVVAAPGNQLISGDYSQAELRVLAHCSGDPYLVNAFREDKDIHRTTAALVFNCDHMGVTPNQRYAAKAINFGLIYGMGPYKLAAKLNLTLEAAKQFIADYFEKFQQLKVFCKTVEEDCKKHGYVTTLANRRRYLPEINYGNKYLQAQARRQAINTVIQGSAADIIKLAMIQVATDAHLKELEAQLVLQIHDELVLDVPEANAKVAAKRLQQVMSSVKLDGKEVLNVPLKVDVGIGGSWAEAH